MATANLYADSTISSSEVRDQAGGTTNLHDPINDATPSDSTYTHTLHNSTDAVCVLGMDNLPTDARTGSPVTALAYDIRTRGFDPGGADDTIHLDVTIYASNGTTAYTDTVRVDSYTGGGGTEAFSDKTGSFTLQTAGTNASESDWNTARIQFDWVYAKLKGGDGVDIDIANAEFQFTYEQASIFALLADNISSATTVSTPTLVHIHNLSADNVSSATTVSSPEVGQEHVLAADNVQSATTVSTNDLGQEHVLLADNIQSASTVSVPDITEVYACFADNIQSATTVSNPAITQDQGLLADNIQSATNTKTVTLLLNYEILRPDADVTVTGWTDEGGATTNLYQSIDEPDTPSDADYVQSPIDPVLASNEYEHSLTNHTGPEDNDGLQRVSYRIRKFPADAKQLNLEVRLKQGTTTIATWSHTNVSGTWTTIQQALTAPQKTSITDYDDLRLEYKADQV